MIQSQVQWTSPAPLWPEIKKPSGEIDRTKFHTPSILRFASDDYVEQFTIRVPELLAKNERIADLYRKDVPDAPDILYKVMSDQRGRLEALRAEKGDYVSPLDL